MNTGEEEAPINEIVDAIKETKALRRDIDEIIQRIKSPESGRGSRSRSIAITKLQEAVMWLGMDLKEINEAHPGASPNPYPESRNPENTAIEPTADGLRL